MKDDTGSALMLGQLDGKVDMILEMLRDHIATSNSKHDTHDERLTALEITAGRNAGRNASNKAWLATAGSSVAAALSVGVALFTHFFKG